MATPGGGGRRRGSLFDLPGRLSDLLEKLQDLAEKGEELSHAGHFGDRQGDVEAVYGFRVKVGIGGREVRAQPFGNVGRDEETGEAVVHEVSEPLVDVFEEEGSILVVAEMPGVAAEDVVLEVREDVLTISAERGAKRYRTEVLLPRPCSRDRMSLACNNGILEIRCR